MSEPGLKPDEGAAAGPVRKVEVLGIPLACVDYDGATAQIRRLAAAGRPSAVSACNTHLVAAAVERPAFAEKLRRFDLIFPDGMPLIWALNARGAGLKDRVYGPYFMRHVLKHGGPGLRHFFFGGTQECLDRLVAAAKSFDPGIRIAGACSPPFRAWKEEDEEAFARKIRESGANVVWIALGGERQEEWIIRNQHRFPSGVFCAVGDAFQLLAGYRPFAPAWMQRRGLTWLYRLWQEPGRLAPRYLKYNTLFLFYALRDRFSRPSAPAVTGNIRIAFIGCRGVPARYAGFERVVEELGARLAHRDYEVTVYNRSHFYKDRPRLHRGMRILYLPTVESKSLETIIHTFLSMIHAAFQDYHIIYLCGVGNSPLAWIGLLGRKRIVINVDGADYRRPKWSGFARWWLHQSEKLAVFVSHGLVADNRQIVQRYRTEYNYRTYYISYGAPTPPERTQHACLEKWNLRPRDYILYVSRLSPENEAQLLLQAYRQLRNPPPLVIVGGAGYEKGYFRELERLAGPGVTFTGPVYGDDYVGLSQNSRFFVLPAAIQATRLVLLDQMAYGAAILYRDNQATREVIGDAGMPFSAEAPLQSLSERMDHLIRHPEVCEALRARALERVRLHYNWQDVIYQYETLFARMLRDDFQPAIWQQSQT
jgi:N-acetylglucosaminyldiphosphoundecaprenol N-acetyl-beta-D-mannosaminyltransferase